jgi:Nucleotide-sugar transporter
MATPSPLAVPSPPAPPAPPPAGKADAGGRSPRADARTKVLALLCLSAVQVFAGVVLKTAQSGGVYAFSPQSSLFMSETVKMSLSAFYLVRDAEGARRARANFVGESNARLVLHMGGLAGVYAWNNALAFWLFARADPGSIMLTKSTSAIVSAVMLYFVRGFVLTPQRWLVLAVQVLGLITAQYDACKGSAVYGPAVYAVLLLTLLNSNIANVWNEYVIQNFEATSLATKNIYLYGIGAALNMIAFLYNRAVLASSPAFFEGYGPAAMAVVLSNALIGITMNIVYKYSDALVKTIATSLTAVILLVLSAVFFGARANAMVFVGGAVLIAGTYLYFAMGLMEARIADAESALTEPRAAGDEEDWSRRRPAAVDARGGAKAVKG